MPRRTRRPPPRKSRAAAEAAPGERLQKVLATLGLASRREAEEWIRAGRLSVNGQPAELGVRVQPTDQIRLDGRLVRQRASRTASAYLCHRSPGEPLRPPQLGGETGEAPPAERTALLERLPRRAGRRFVTVSPMPRVDGGLELVTADGDLAARLQRAVRGLASEFSVRIRGELTETQLQGVLSGVLDRPEPLQVECCEAAGGEAANRWYAITARGASGKDIRQLFERQAAQVSRVLRTRLGPLVLERSLPRGRYRELTATELQALLAGAAGAPAAE